MAIAIYDLKCAPITFDFVNFLAMAHMRAHARGDGFFDVVIRADSYRNSTPREKSYSLREREWRLRNLILELCKVTVACRNLSVIRHADWMPQDHNLFPEYDLINRVGVPYLPIQSLKVFSTTGVRPVVFAPSDSARAAVANLVDDEAPLVTFTLRRAAFDTARNTDLRGWQAAADMLQARGFSLLVLPDQDDCLGDRALFSQKWSIFEPAAFSLDLRLAVMERAVLNLVSAGGMAVPAWYSDIPYVIFNLLHENHYVAGRDYFRKFAGIEVGNNLLWARPNQILEWETSDPMRLIEKHLAG